MAVGRWLDRGSWFLLLALDYTIYWALESKTLRVCNDALVRTRLELVGCHITITECTRGHTWRELSIESIVIHDKTFKLGEVADLIWNGAREPIMSKIPDLSCQYSVSLLGLLQNTYNRLRLTSSPILLEIGPVILLFEISLQ